MAEQGISQHKRLAMGDRPDKRFAGGGPIITPRLTAPTLAPRMSKAQKLPGMAPQPMNPVQKAKMNNGVPGMKKGGRCG